MYKWGVNYHTQHSTEIWKCSNMHVYQQGYFLWLHYFFSGVNTVSCRQEIHVTEILASTTFLPSSPSLHQCVTSSAGSRKTDIYQTLFHTHTRANAYAGTHTHTPNLGQRAIKISTKSCALPWRCNENNSNRCGMPIGVCYTFHGGCS